MTEKFNILVVDDDPDKLQLLCFILQKDGYEVFTASDGEEGLRAVETHQPDLIITDVMMPKVDGYELARRVRANPNTKFVPVIIQTAAHSDAGDARRGAEVGALDYITDPTDIELLRARVRTLLDFKSYLNHCEEAAFTDHLSGLANRRRFERQMEREVTRTKRYNHPFCLLLVDIDHFKTINDTYGHEAGDEAIRRIGEILQAGTRGIDLAARIGGEEFAVILTETNFNLGFEVAERLRNLIAAAEIQSIDRSITASFGVAEFPSCASSQRDLITVADAALYEAKRLGRNRAVRAAPASSPNQTTAKIV
jgi:diguanylate cyclase (GGDEF)-like protein